MLELLDLIGNLGGATIRIATPLLLAALGGLFSERSGIVDLGLEGKMLAAAFASATVAAVTGALGPALLAGMAAAMALSLLHGFACITHRGNQVISGLGINIVAAGLCPTLAVAWFGQGGRTPIVADSARLMPFDALGGHNILVLAALLLVPAIAWVLARTRFGLRLRAAGENPHALDTAGVSVAGLRYRALLINGALCGAAGAHLALAQNAGFLPDMTAGRGYLALAALVFGKWRPVPTLLACLLFALTDAIQIRLQGAVIPGIGQLPVQFVQALPYVLTVLLLGGLVGRAVPPSALGIPFVKSR